MYAIRSYYEQAGRQGYDERQRQVAHELAHDSRPEQHRRKRRQRRRRRANDRVGDLGSGLHDCLNPACALFHEPVITSYSIHYTKLYDCGQAWREGR